MEKVAIYIADGLEIVVKDILRPKSQFNSFESLIGKVIIDVESCGDVGKSVILELE